MPVEITLLRPTQYRDALQIIRQGLEDRWGHYDQRANPDLLDFPKAYRGDYVFIASEGPATQGVGILRPRPNRVGEIVRMSVRQENQRKGIGSEILSTIVAKARTLGIRLVELETTSTWESALRFYTKHGFQLMRLEGSDQFFELRL